MKVNITPKYLLNLALKQVEETQKNFPNEVIYLYYSEELTEYTVVPNSSVSKLLEIEPNLKLVAKYKDGVKL